MSSDWYWAELRSAVAAGEAERGWQLLAAWPSSGQAAGGGVPEEEEDAARQYFFQGGRSLDWVNVIIDTAWMLKHYRQMPVTFQMGGPPNRGRLSDPDNFSWNGQSVRCLPSEGEVEARLVVTDEGGLAAAEARLSQSSAGWPVATLQFNVLSTRDEDAHPRPPGVYVSEEEEDSPRGTHLVGMLDLRGAQHVAQVARLFQRLGKELESLMEEAPPRLLWDEDILRQLRADGLGAHPRLTFIGSSNPLPEHSTLLTSQRLREVWLGKEVKPDPLVFSERAVRGLHSRGRESLQLEEEIQDFLNQHNDPRFTPRHALALLNRSEEEVRALSGDAADAQLERLRLTQVIRPLLEAWRESWTERRPSSSLQAIRQAQRRRLIEEVDDFGGRYHDLSTVTFPAGLSGGFEEDDSDDEDDFYDGDVFQQEYVVISNEEDDRDDEDDDEEDHRDDEEDHRDDAALALLRRMGRRR